MSLRTDSDRFLLDGMLGILARKLRMLGLDAEFSADADPAMIRYRSRAEARIVLTRNPKLVKILGDGGWLVTGTDAREEFQSLVPLLRMIKPSRDPFSRCLDCNTRLVNATREQARDSVPYYVWKNTEHFMTCSSCDKNYWKGTHHRRMLDEVREMEEELKQG